MAFGIAGAAQPSQEGFIQMVFLHEVAVRQKVSFDKFDGALNHPLGLWVGFVTDPEIQPQQALELLKLVGVDDIALVFTDDNDAVLIYNNLLSDSTKEIKPTTQCSNQIQ